MTYELVMADDGFGARLERRMIDEGDPLGLREAGCAACAHCGASTVWIYRRSHRGPISTGQDHTAPAASLESWREKPYCTILCACRAINCGNLALPGVGPVGRGGGGGSSGSGGGTGFTASGAASQ